MIPLKDRNNKINKIKIIAIIKNKVNNNIIQKKCI